LEVKRTLDARRDHVDQERLTHMYAGSSLARRFLEKDPWLRTLKQL